MRLMRSKGNTVRTVDRRDGGTADLLALRCGEITKAEFEARNGITDVRDSRHASWYAERRAQDLAELRASSTPAPIPAPKDDYETWAEDVQARALKTFEAIAAEGELR